MEYKKLSPQARGASREQRPAAPREPEQKTLDQKATRRRVEVLETYFGADGRPVKRKSIGAARVARRYDERGNKVEEAYFNADGKPTLRKGLGVARIAWRYDERGRQIDAAFFGADGKPIDKAARGAGARLFEEA